MNNDSLNQRMKESDMLKGVKNNTQKIEEAARKAQNQSPLTQTHTFPLPLTTLRNIPQMPQNRHEHEDAIDNTPLDISLDQNLLLTQTQNTLPTLQSPITDVDLCTICKDNENITFDDLCRICLIEVDMWFEKYKTQ